MMWRSRGIICRSGGHQAIAFQLLNTSTGADIGVIEI